MILIASMYDKAKGKVLKLDCKLTKVSKVLNVNYFGDKEKAFGAPYYTQYAPDTDPNTLLKRDGVLVEGRRRQVVYTKPKKIDAIERRNILENNLSWVSLPTTHIEFEFLNKKTVLNDKESNFSKELRNLFLNNRTEVQTGALSDIESVAISKHILGVFHLRYHADKEEGSGWYWVPIAFGDMSSLAVQALPGRKNFYKVTMKILDFTAMLNLKTFEENIDMKKYHEIINTPYKKGKSKKDVNQKEVNKTERIKR